MSKRIVFSEIEDNVNNVPPYIYLHILYLFSSALYMQNRILTFVTENKSSWNYQLFAVHALPNICRYGKKFTAVNALVVIFFSFFSALC